jgi:flagellar biosynthetic protein FliO
MDKAMMLAFVKMIVSLGAVLALFVGAVFLFRKLSQNSKGFLRRAASGNLKPIEILAFQSLGPGKSLYLIRCLDRKLLVGSTNTSINAIATLSGESEEESETEEGFASSLERESSAKPEQSLKKQISASLREISRV